MATAEEGKTEGGQNGPSESVRDEQRALEAFAGLIGSRLISLSGELTPEAAIQVDLRDPAGRGAFLENLLHEIVPTKSSPTFWARWLGGGPGPFGAGRIEPPEKRRQSIGKTISRGPTTLRQCQERVARKEAELADAVEDLRYREALDKSFIAYALGDHFVSLLSPIFAMGPAWTLMRVTSSHLPFEVAERETILMFGDEKVTGLEKLKADRASESEKMLGALDFFSGVVAFEEALRDAILKVVDDFEGRKEEVVKDGRKARSKDRAAASIRPEATPGSGAILDGLRPAA